MNDHDLAGKTSNYEFGYIPREEPIPEGWVKTLRPCMGCSSSVTYIDKDKIWHCLKCGWVSDNDNNVWENQDEKEQEMSKVYTENELQLIADCIDEGMNVKQIAGKLGRPYQGVWAKVKEVKRMMENAIVEGATGNEPEGEIVDSASEDIPYPTGVFYDSSNDTLVSDSLKDNPQPTEGDLRVQEMQNQIDGLQIDLIEMETYARSLEKQLEEAKKIISNKSPSNTTPHARISRALGKAEEAGMRLRNVQVGCDGEAFLQFNLVLTDSTDKDETELPF